MAESFVAGGEREVLSRIVPDLPSPEEYESASQGANRTMGTDMREKVGVGPREWDVGRGCALCGKLRGGIRRAIVGDTCVAGCPSSAR